MSFQPVLSVGPGVPQYYNAAIVPVAYSQQQPVVQGQQQFVAQGQQQQFLFPNAQNIEHTNKVATGVFAAATVGAVVGTAAALAATGDLQVGMHGGVQGGNVDVGLHQSLDVGGLHVKQVDHLGVGADGVHYDKAESVGVDGIFAVSKEQAQEISGDGAIISEANKCTCFGVSFFEEESRIACCSEGECCAFDYDLECFGINVCCCCDCTVGMPSLSCLPDLSDCNLGDCCPCLPSADTCESLSSACGSLCTLGENCLGCLCSENNPVCCVLGIIFPSE